MEPFKNNTDVDILILNSQFDEFIFKQAGEYQGKQFVNIESAYEEIQKDLGNKIEDEVHARHRLPEEDVTGFCLWMKNELSERVMKVTISKRLKDGPALLTGQMSSSMRVMMQMIEAQGQNPNAMGDMQQMAKDNTLELNPGHPIVVNLN
jgi:molecular chaperone HtpG/TNF receptor-associated protein 1